MKNKGFIFLIAIIAIIGCLFLVGCDSDSGDDDPTSISYTSYDASGNSYNLLITKDPNRAVYNPQSGDSYVLTIKNSSGTTLGTSTGKISSVSGSTFTLEKGGKTFTIAVNGNNISSIQNDIPLDAGGTYTPPDTLTPNNPNNPNSGNSKFDIPENWQTMTDDDWCNWLWNIIGVGKTKPANWQSMSNEDWLDLMENVDLSLYTESEIAKMESNIFWLEGKAQAGELPDGVFKDFIIFLTQDDPEPPHFP